jgi:hypothetical protein
MQVNGNAKELQLSARIVRADGTIVELGTIDYWHKNPFKRLNWRIKSWLHSWSTRVKQLLQTT